MATTLASLPTRMRDWRASMPRAMISPACLGRQAQQFFGQLAPARRFVVRRPLRHAGIARDRRRHAARMDDADADACCRRAHGAARSKSRAPRICWPSRRFARRRDDAVDARDVHDARLVALAQQRQEGARHAHHAVEIDVHQPVEIVLAHLLEAAAEGHAGVVDEQVDALVGGEHLRRQRAHGLAVGHVERMGGDAHAHVAEHRGRFLEAGADRCRPAPGGSRAGPGNGRWRGRCRCRRR